MKNLILKFIPSFIIQSIVFFRNKKRCVALKNLTSKDAFEKVYSDGMWGRSDNPNEKFFSGTGSHTVEIVSTYVNSVEKFLKAQGKKLDAVDLGCGDFAVGSKIRGFCGKYIACDVVDELIIRNKEKFQDLSVDFRVLDITNDCLPDGEIIFIRQVLQHLSNKHISTVLTKLQRKYKYLILTEHLPKSYKFIANIDKPIGGDIRLGLGKRGSGVVITKHPFNFKIKSEKVLCEVEEDDGIITTILYELL